MEYFIPFFFIFLLFVRMSRSFNLFWHLCLRLALCGHRYKPSRSYTLNLSNMARVFITYDAVTENSRDE